MSRLRARARLDERGAALILAIAFMVVIGGIGAAVISSVTSGVKDRLVLDQVRDREYAADGGVEYAIAKVRTLPLPGGPGQADCGVPSDGRFIISPPAPSLNGVNIRVECSNQPTLTLIGGFLQRDVVFTACVDANTACTDATTIIRAQVNYQAISAGSVLNVTRTWVQSWSVNR